MIKKERNAQAPDNILRVALLPRVSTEEQVLRGYSLQAQEDALVAYANEHNMKIVGIYRDEGHSARKPVLKRPVMLKLLEDIKADKIDRVLFIKLDRWFRNVSEYHAIQAILDQHNVTWQAIMEDYNTATADGRLKVNIMLSVAENEADRTSERIRFVQNAKIQRGETLLSNANAPFGYRVEKIDGVRRLVKDPETEPIVTEFFRLAKEYSIRRAGEMMNEQYGLNRLYAQWNKMMVSEFYTGTYRGVVNFCPAYTTAEEQYEIRNPERYIKKAQNNRVYLFTGMIKCPHCGNRMTGKSTRSSTGEDYLYYRCHRAQVSHLCDYRKTLSEIKIEKQLLEMVRPELEKYILNAEVDQPEQKAKKKANTKEKLQEQLRRLNVTYIAGNMNDADYQAAADELKRRIAEAQVEAMEEKKPDTEALKAFLASDFETVYKSLDKENRRRMWRSILSEIKIQGTEVTAIVPRV